jgi:hypothetical protein
VAAELTLIITRKLFHLTASDWVLILGAYGWLTAISVALRLVGFRRLMLELEKHAITGHAAIAPSGSSAPGTPSANELARALRYARWINAASRRHYVRGQCLHRSLVLHCWLQREGLPSHLRIGVRKAGNDLQAHAWVELGRQAVSDPANFVTPFTPLTDQSGSLAQWGAVLPRLQG